MLLIGGCSESRVPKLEDDLAKSKSDTADKQKQLDKIQSDFAILQRSDDKLKSDYQNTITTYKSQIELLSQQLSDSQKSKTEIAAKLLESQNNLAAIENQSQREADEAESQKNTIPLAIVEALNDMVSSVNTGISRGDYGKKLIALKTAIATYGNQLSSVKIGSLSTIVSNYDTALTFWNKSQTGDYGVQTISLMNNNIYDKPEEESLSRFDIPYRDENIGGTAFREYLTPNVLSKFWKISEDGIKQLLKQQGN